METDITIRLCGLKFKRQCPLNWDKLRPLGDDASRHCDTCDRPVFLCESDEETMFHAERGDCIARLTPATSELPNVILGEPDVEWLRANKRTPAQEEAQRLSQREGRIDGALSNLRFAAMRCADCGFPVPSWCKTCRVCGSIELRVPVNCKLESTI
jgi:hypothetical protein